MNNLDKFFNKKLQNRSFEFKDSHWDEAEQLIVADEKKRRVGGFLWLFGLLFIAILGGSIFWLSLPKSETEKTNAEFLEKHIENQKPKTANLEVASDEWRENTNQEPGVSGEWRDKTANQERGSRSEELVRKTANHKLQTKNQKLKTKNQKQQTKNQERVASGEKSGKITKNQELQTANLKPITSIWEKMEDPAYPDLEKLSIPKNKKVALGLTASSLLYPSSSNGKNWIGASLGLVGQYKLSNSLSLNMELLYTYRTGTFGVSARTTQTTFSFGKQQLEYSTNPESLHFIELPIYAEYRLGRHGIEGGFTFSYLAGVLGNIEKQTSLLPWERTDESIYSTENYSSGWLSKTGFNSFNTSVLLGYRYHMNQHFVLGLRSTYRLSKLVNVTGDKEEVLLESGPVNFNVSASWFFLK